MTPSKVALFGTSADPPTAGHLAILQWLSRRFDYVAVWASNNPFKSHQTPLSHRETMLRLLIGDLDTPEPNVFVHPELSSPRTLISVERAQQWWGQHVDLSFVIGSDLIPQLPSWFQIETLLHQVKLVVIHRPGYPLWDRDLRRLEDLGARIAIADLTGPDVSSTAYRENGDPDALTPMIAAYIRREHLYAWQQDGPPAKVQIH